MYNIQLKLSRVTNALELVIEPTMEHKVRECQFKDEELNLKKDLTYTK